MDRFGKKHMGGKRAMSISRELTVLSVSAGNDGYKDEAYGIPDRAPRCRGDLRYVFIISSDYGPFQSLTKYLNLLCRRCEAFQAISLRYSQAILAGVYFIHIAHEFLTIHCCCWVTEESVCGEGSGASSGRIEASYWKRCGFGDLCIFYD